MKKILLLAICALSITSCDNDPRKKYSLDGYNKPQKEYSIDEYNDAREDYVYICTGGKSKRYHADEYCNGLRRCSGSVEEVSVDEAEDMGRTPCKICY